MQLAFSLQQNVPDNFPATVYYNVSHHSPIWDTQMASFLISAVGAAANTVHACYAPAQDHDPQVELLAEWGGHVES